MQLPEPEYRTLKVSPPARPRGPVEALKRWLMVAIGTVYAVIFLAVLLGGLLIYSSTAKADPIPVLAECVELAAREGFPTDTLTKTQAARARLRLARLSDRDPLVKTCREAVRAARAAAGGRP